VHIHRSVQTASRVLAGPAFADRPELAAPAHRNCRPYAALRGRASVRLADFLHEQALELDDVYRVSTGQGRSGWTALKRDAGLPSPNPARGGLLSRRMADLYMWTTRKRWI